MAYGMTENKTVQCKYRGTAFCYMMLCIHFGSLVPSLQRNLWPSSSVTVFLLHTRLQTHDCKRAWQQHSSQLDI